MDAGASRHFVAQIFFCPQIAVHTAMKNKESVAVFSLIR